MRFVFLLLFFAAIAATAVLYNEKATAYTQLEADESARHEEALSQIEQKIDELTGAAIEVRDQLRTAEEAYPVARDKAVAAYREDLRRQRTQTQSQQRQSSGKSHAALDGLREEQMQLELATREAAKAHKELEERISGEIAANKQGFESRKSLALQELNVKLLEERNSKKRFSQAAGERQDKQRKDLEAKWNKDEQEIVKINGELEQQINASRDALAALTADNKDRIEQLKAKTEELRQTAATAVAAPETAAAPAPQVQPGPNDIEKILLERDPKLKKIKEDAAAQAKRLDTLLQTQTADVEALYRQSSQEETRYEDDKAAARAQYTDERDSLLLYGILAIAALGLITLYSFISARNMY